MTGSLRLDGNERQTTLRLTGILRSGVPGILRASDADAQRDRVTSDNRVLWPAGDAELRGDAVSSRVGDRGNGQLRNAWADDPQNADPEQCIDQSLSGMANKGHTAHSPDTGKISA